MIVVNGQFVLYREARRHKKVIIAQQVSQDVKRRFPKEQNASKMTTFVFISVLVIRLRATLTRLFKSTSNISLTVATVFYSVVGFLLILNSSVNPFIYATVKR